MAQIKVFTVTYQIALRASGKGAKDVYRKPVQQTNVAASSASAVAATLASNTTLVGSEVIDIIDIHEHASGGQGLFT